MPVTGTDIGNPDPNIEVKRGAVWTDARTETIGTASTIALRNGPESGTLISGVRIVNQPASLSDVLTPDETLALTTPESGTIDIISIVDNANDTVTVTFSAAITNTATGVSQAILVWVDGNEWTACDWPVVTNATSAVLAPDGPSPYTFWAVTSSGTQTTPALKTPKMGPIT